MSTKALPWFRIYIETVDDEKLRLLAFEDRWHYIALLCCKGQGILDEGGSLTMRKVAVKLGLSVRELEEVARRLAEVGLIDDRETLQPCGWDDRQFRSDSDPTAAERKRRQREHNRNAEAVTDRSRVTQRDMSRSVTRTEAEAELTNTDVLVVASDADDPIPSAIEADQSRQRPKLTKPQCPHQQVLALYHELLPASPTIRDWTPARAKHLRCRWNEDPKRQNLDWWRRFFGYIAESAFLAGRVSSGNRKPFTPGLDWICKAENFAKIREGRFHDEAAA
ncbi:MAG: hypothetical protein VB141_13430 [Burkholderia gladioli]